MTEATEEFTRQIARESRRAWTRLLQAHSLRSTLDMLIEKADEEIRRAGELDARWRQAAVAAGAPRETTLCALVSHPRDALPQITMILDSLEDPIYPSGVVPAEAAVD